MFSITQLQGTHKMQLVFHPTGQEILVRCLMQLSQHKLPEVLKEQGRTDKVFLSEFYINFRNENADNQIDGYNDSPQMKQISNGK